MLKRMFAFALLAAAIAFAQPMQAADLSLDGNLRGLCGTVSATGNGTAGAATLSNKCGVVTTEALTTPTASTYTLTLTNTVAAAADIVLFSVANGTNTTGIASAGTATPGAGSIVFTVRLDSGTFGGTMAVRYLLIKP